MASVKMEQTVIENILKKSAKKTKPAEVQELVKRDTLKSARDFMPKDSVFTEETVHTCTVKLKPTLEKMKN